MITQQQISIVQLLQHVNSSDNELRKNTEKRLFQLSYINPYEFIKQITMELTDEKQDVHIRFLSGLIFTMITTKQDPHTNLTAWERLAPEQRQVVQKGILSALDTSKHQVRKGASNAVAKVARIDLERGRWGQLIPMLIEGMKQPNIDLKLSCMLTVGKICQDAKSYIPRENAKQLFTILLHQLSIQDEKVHSYGLQSVLVMSPLAGMFLENDEEFSILISEVVLKFLSDQNLSIKLQQRAWRCMNEICHFFYPSIFNKYEYVITKVFQILGTDPESDLYEFLSVISVETLTTIIIEEFQRNRRKLFSINLIPPIAQKLSNELIIKLKQISLKVSEMDELTTGIFPAIETCLQRLIQFVGKPATQLIEDNISQLFEEEELKCVAITVASCYFACPDHSKRDQNQGDLPPRPLAERLPPQRNNVARNSEMLYFGEGPGINLVMGYGLYPSMASLAINQWDKIEPPTDGRVNNEHHTQKGPAKLFVLVFILMLLVFLLSGSDSHYFV